MSSTAGRLGLVKIGGTPTTFTDQAVTERVTGKTYQISNTAMRVWSPTSAITVKIGGSTASPTGGDPFSINRLTATIAFTNTNLSRGTVTTSGTYLPMLTVAKGTSISYMHGNAGLDDTTFDSNGYDESIPGIHSVSATLGKNWESTYNTILQNALINGSLLVVQIYHNKDTAPDLAFWARPTKDTISAATRAIVGSELTFVGSHDVDNRVISLI